jgi:hypothetical protein
MERVPVIEPNYDESATTPAWAYFPDVPLKLFQRLFVTATFLPLALIGAFLLLRTADDRRKLLIVAIVPLYFFVVQPIVHTEYRYLLPATHTVVVLASLPLGWLWIRLVRSKSDGLAVAE